MMLIEVITDPPVGVPLHVIVALDYRDHVSQEVHLVVVENLETIAPVTRESGMIKTLPKAQRTRGLSSSYQSNFLRSYHEFKHKS